MTLNRRRRLLSPEDIDRFSQACEAIAASSSDPSGFVSVRALLERFQARLICRPLLVEGMFGSIAGENAPGNRQWVVLINSKKHFVNDEDVLNETSAQPLSSRFRFTVAHELAHSLAFRASDFGIQLRSANASAFGDAELVEALEADADVLAATLLCNSNTLRSFFRSQGTSTDLSQLCRLRRRLGVSRPVLINRIRHLSSSREFPLRGVLSLANTALGVGTWKKESGAVLNAWPVFANFADNLVPKLLLDLANRDHLRAIEVFDDPDFALCSGQQKSIEFSMPIGTPSTLSGEQLELVCEFEDIRREDDSSFLWMVSGKVRPQPFSLRS